LVTDKVILPVLPPLHNTGELDNWRLESSKPWSAWTWNVIFSEQPELLSSTRNPANSTGWLVNTISSLSVSKVPGKLVFPSS